MKRMVPHAFIWDMDGTLVDSYSCIVPALKEFCDEFGLDYSEEFIRDYVLRHSAGELFEMAAPGIGKDPAWLKKQYGVRNDSHIDGIRPMSHAVEVVERLTRAGHLCFVYTHRGASSLTILKNTGLLPFFTEVVTALYGFPRKPAPDGIQYLMEKYSLDPKISYYVGDRPLDIQSANNAGIESVLFLSEGSPVCPDGIESFLIHDLSEIELIAQIN